MGRTSGFLLALCLLAPPGCERPRSSPPSTPVAPDLAPLDVLVRRMHQRLELMHDVARVKWNTHAPSHDPVREEALLKDVAERGRGHSLDVEFTRAFFAAQMDAAKLIQEDDFRQWRAVNQPPFRDAPDLSTLRKQLDALNADLLAALADARPLLNGDEGQRQLDLRAAPLLASFKPQVVETALRPLRNPAPR